MLELFRLPLCPFNEIKVTPGMIGMTGRAIDQTLTAVKPNLLSKLPRDFGMAVGASLIEFGRIPTATMTSETLSCLVEVTMRFSQRAR